MTKVFFYLLFGCPRSTFGHCGGRSLTNSINHCVFLILFGRSLEAFRTKLTLLLNTSGQMLSRLLAKVFVRVFFSIDCPFRVSLKNSCNEKHLKVGTSEIGEIKRRAGKWGTYSKGFPESIIKFLSVLNIPAFERSQLLTKHKWRHRCYPKIIVFLYIFQEFLYDRNGIQTHNHLLCKQTLNHSAKLAKSLRCVVSTSLYGAGQSMQSIHWVASGSPGFFPFNETHTVIRPSKIDLITRN